MYGVYSDSIDAIQRKFSKYMWYKIFSAYSFTIATSYYRRSSFITCMKYLGVALLFNLIHYNVVCSALVEKLDSWLHILNSRSVFSFCVDRARINISYKFIISFICAEYSKISITWDMMFTILQVFTKSINLDITSIMTFFFIFTLLYTCLYLCCLVMDCYY